MEKNAEAHVATHVGTGALFRDAAMAPVVGLTGSIASGKSTAAAEFARLGIPVIDADALARDAVAPGSDTLCILTERFGDDIVASDGSLDRSSLAAKVFGNADAVRTLNGIVHPRVFELSRQRALELSKSAPPYIIYDAALIIEAGRARDVSALIVVDTPEAVRAQRIVARDGISMDQALRRIHSQLPDGEKLKHADFVIKGGGTIHETQQQARAIHAQLLARFGSNS